MDVVFTHGAGWDVHQKTVTACRVTPDPSGPQADGILELSVFGTMTAVLLALSDWRAAGGLTQAAMESTGEYWHPVYHLLEGNVTILLVHAAPVKQVPGRQTDKADARWFRQTPARWLAGRQLHPAAGAAGCARPDARPHQVSPGTPPRSQPGARGAGTGEH